MKAELANQIIEKAKSKNDGVFSHKGYKYIVVNHRFKAWCRFKEVYEVSGSFFVKLGEIQVDYNRENELKAILKQYQKNG